jgi:hypothetical protein
MVNTLPVVYLDAFALKGILIKSCYVLALLLWIEVGRLFWICVHDIWYGASG